MHAMVCFEVKELYVIFLFAKNRKKKNYIYNVLSFHNKWRFANTKWSTFFFIINIIINNSPIVTFLLFLLVLQHIIFIGIHHPGRYTFYLGTYVKEKKKYRNIFNFMINGKIITSHYYVLDLWIFFNNVVIYYCLFLYVTTH